MKHKCPNCGAENTKAICEYCGSVITPPSPNNEKKDTETVYILPWPKKYKSDDDLIVKFFTLLRDKKDAPVDVFSEITDIKVSRYYLPMRQFKGCVSTDWRCIQVFDRKRIVDYEYKDGKKKPIYEYYEEYIPANGKGHRHFNFLISVATNVGLPQTLIKCLGTNPINENITDKALPLSSALLEDEAIIIDEASSIKEKDVKARAEKRIGREADNASFQNLSGRLKDCDFTYQWRYGSAENKRLLVPAATVTYLYKEKEYCFALVFNGESRIDYPKEENNLTKEIDTQSKKFTKTGWLTFALSFILTIVILCIWGDMKHKPLRIVSTFGTIIMTIITAWKALSISGKYDEMKKYGYDLLAVRRTDILKKAFPRYANHPAINKLSTDESGATSKIHKTKSSIRNNRLHLKLLLLCQIFIIVGGLVNMNRIDRREKAKARIQQERLIEQERIEREKKQEEQNRLKPIKDWILSELKGQTYTGESLYEGKKLSINFLDNSQISYKSITDSHSNWSSPKIVPFTLDVREASYGESKWYKIKISFDGFYSEEVNVYTDRFNVSHFAIEGSDVKYILNNTSLGSLPLNLRN